MIESWYTLSNFIVPIQAHTCEQSSQKRYWQNQLVHKEASKCLFTRYLVPHSRALGSTVLQVTSALPWALEMGQSSVKKVELATLQAQSSMTPSRKVWAQPRLAKASWESSLSCSHFMTQRDILFPLLIEYRVNPYRDYPFLKLSQDPALFFLPVTQSHKPRMA